MAITYITENVCLPRQLKKRRISQWIRAVIQAHGRKTGDIAYIFCNDERILEINTQYLKHTYFTDIITFDYSNSNTISGDIFISLDTVKDNSALYKTNYEDELLRVIIHGILHLCSFDDKTQADSHIMREKENESLNLYKGSLNQ